MPRDEKRMRTQQKGRKMHVLVQKAKTGLGRLSVGSKPLSAGLGRLGLDCVGGMTPDS